MLPELRLLGKRPAEVTLLENSDDQAKKIDQAEAHAETMESQHSSQKKPTLP